MSNTTTAPSVASKRGPYVAPRNGVEELLVAMWSETLNMDAGTISIHDSLFDLGGAHSLLIVQLIARIADRFNVELPIADILAQPTISQLAMLIDNTGGDKSSPG